MTAEGNNPLIGLLLCTQKEHALVKYALAAIDSRLFVSKYHFESATRKTFSATWRKNAGN